MMKHILLIVMLALFTFSPTAKAFIITSQLTGDLRPGSPDGLFIDVTITVDEINTPMKASWLVDVNSPLHPNAKLDAFYFNLAPSINSSDISFTNIQPNDKSGWYVSTSNGTSGVGGVVFDYESDKNSGQPASDVTNSLSLTFDMIATFVLETSDFLDALAGVGNGNAGSGQLGAHLLSLTKGTGDTTDSGFLFGSYTYDDGGGGGGGSVVPEPSTFVLLGAGLAGLAFYRRKKR